MGIFLDFPFAAGKRVDIKTFPVRCGFGDWATPEQFLAGFFVEPSHFGTMGQ
jgi:hypothetical protein